MSALTIAFVTVHPGLYLPPRASDSVARVIEAHINGLIELGHRVILLGPASCRAKCDLIPICKSTITIEDDPDGIQARDIAINTKNILSKISAQIDIVQAHSVDIPGLLFTSDYLDDCQLPHVTTLHSCIELSNLPLFMKCGGPFISLSFSQRAACPTLQYAGNVHNGLDVSLFPEVQQPDDYVCFLGRIAPEKQPHLALELASYLHLPIRIAGPITNQEYFEKKCLPLLHGDAKYLGELDMMDKINLLAHSRCNLHPTGFRDPCPLVPIEAGLCGTPTMAINRGALREIINDNITGVLVEDFVEGAFRIQDCFTMDRKVVSSIYRNEFNHIKMAKSYVDVYKSIIG